MKIYAHEILDGLHDKIVENSTVAVTSQAREVDNPNIKPIEISIASANAHQATLFSLESVLVSTGWNNNDDVFLPAELWAAKATPEDQQFNYMHDEKDIIGHITGNYVANFNNEKIDDSTDTIPSEFNIVTSAVLYTSWSDPKLAERMERIISEIKDGKWFVSMECLFPSFDYQLKNVSTGQVIDIERSEATAYLSKYLRAYGGDGVYQGYKVGRVLRNLAFSGKGLVDKPANPKSIILSTEKAISGEINMSEDITKELESVKAALAEAQETINSLTSFKSQAETLQVSITELQTELTSVKASLADALKARDEAQAKFDKMEKDQKMAKRKASLAEAGVEDSEMEDSLASFEGMSDEAFDKIVAMMKKKCKKGMEDEECAKKAKCEDTEAKEIEVTVEVETSKASINDLAKGNDVPLQELVSGWFNNNVLKTLKS